MDAPHTPRARARAQMIEDIKAAALRQVLAEGAAALSLRAVSRDLGVVSSATYRYFASRDDLLTALITDSYRELGDAVSAAVEASPGDGPGDGGGPGGAGGPAALRGRWRTACSAWREWALAQPHRFQLLYGTPVPGYAAPASTVEAAAHAVAPLVAVVAAAPTLPAGRATGELSQQARAAAVALGVDAARAVPLYQAFGQLVGLITLEVNGHLVGAFEPAGPLWEHTVEDLADRLHL